MIHSPARRLATAGMAAAALAAVATTAPAVAAVRTASAPARSAHVTVLPSVPLPPSRAHRGAICYSAHNCYDYANGAESATARGASVVLFQARPEINLNDAGTHSLQELAVEDAQGRQIVEIGWTVDLGLNGDTRPHLFVYHWVDGVGKGYNRPGFTRTSKSIKPGMAVAGGRPARFAIAYSSHRWWLSYNGHRFGYYRASLWGNRYTKAGLVQAFGEVSSATGRTCNDMGNGRFGSSSHASYIKDFRLIGSSAPSRLTISATSPKRYSVGHRHSTSFRLGGPGTGRCH